MNQCLLQKSGMSGADPCCSSPIRPPLSCMPGTRPTVDYIISVPWWLSMTTGCTCAHLERGSTAVRRDCAFPMTADVEPNIRGRESAFLTRLESAWILTHCMYFFFQMSHPMSSLFTLAGTHKPVLKCWLNSASCFNLFIHHLCPGILG